MLKIEEHCKKVQGYMKAYTVHDYKGSEVSKIFDRLYDPSGKMIRALLVIISAKISERLNISDKNEDMERVYRMAALIELTHYTSLIHDDVIDDSPIRRGKVSIQSAYGKNAAVLAGDILISRICTSLVIEGVDEISLMMTKLLEEMSVGEIIQDLRKYDSVSGMEDYLSAVNGKTARMFCVACQVGCVCMGAEEEIKEIFAGIGEKLGIMFQIRDDYLDYISSKDAEGKETDKDFFEGIYTYPLLAACDSDEARAKLDEYFRKNSDGELSNEDFTEVKKLIEEFEGFKKTREFINQLAEECTEKIEILERKIRDGGSTCPEIVILKEIVANVQRI